MPRLKRLHHWKGDPPTENTSENLPLPKKSMQWTCNVCGKEFLYQSRLIRHFVKHSGENKLACNVCGKGFLYPSQLKQHFVKHSGENKLACHVCGKAFSFKKSLRLHLLLHTEETQHVCDTCGNIFTQLIHLEEHLKVHTGEKATEKRCTIKDLLQKESPQALHSLSH